MRNKFIVGIFLFLIVLLLSFFIKGQKGNPIKNQSPKDRTTAVTSPLESSNSTARYALTEAIVNDKRFYFNEEEARFASPDLVLYNKKYFSIFTPGISFIGVPFYMVGKLFGIPQITTFLSTTFFAFINTLLIAYIVKKLKGNIFQGILCGVIFLFSTNALSYALTFTQHHATTFVLLLMLINVLSKPTIKNNIIFGALMGLGVLFDIPNLFLMAPIIIYKALQHFEISKTQTRMTVFFQSAGIFILLGILPLLVLFGWYNHDLTGSFTKIGQSIGRSQYPPKKVTTTTATASATLNAPSPFSFTFNTRRQLNGFYTLITSDERGIFYYSPILLLGVLGMIISYRKKDNLGFVLLGISLVSVNILLYAMFIDPWGGWAFGPRYLIPAEAILSIFAFFAISKYQTKIWFMIISILLAGYSIWVNLIGALTTAAIPPKVEAIHLITPIPYTYTYNLEFIGNNISSSLFYNLFFSNTMNLFSFSILLYFGIFILFCGLYICGLQKEK